MSSKESDLLAPEFLELIPTSAANYIESLQLPKDGPILFVLDKQHPSNKDIAARRVLAQNIASNVRQNSHQTLTLEFDENLTYEEMYSQTGSTMQALEKINTYGQKITVIFLGAQWTNRQGMYDAVGEFSNQTREARMAISPQATVEDIKVMSWITPEKLAQIGKGIDYFEKYFDTHPQGKLVIKTQKEGIYGELTVNFDTGLAPFSHDRGVLDDNHPDLFSTNKGPISNASNNLGTESYASPYPFEKSQGTYVSKEGIKFTVVDGYIISAENWEGVYESLENKQKRFIDILNERAVLQQTSHDFEQFKIALTEIGLGGFSLVGIIELPPGCSTLFLEKLGPHLGGATPPGKTPQADGLFAAAREINVTHADFVMPPNTKIDFVSKTGVTEQLYPPLVNIN